MAFFVDVVRTGTVAGADWTFTPDEVAQAMGIEPAENQNGRSLWHDYGLVEFFWEQTADGQSWRGTHFSVQVHRLGGGVEYVLPPVVADATATATATASDEVAFDALCQALEPVSLVPMPWSDPDLHAWCQPDSTVLVLVVTDDPDPASHASTVRPGHVYKISAPHHPGRIDLTGIASTGMGATARHLLNLDMDGRYAWLTRRLATETGDANWWLHLYGHVDVRIHEQPRRRPQWVVLRLWLLDRAATVGPFRPHEHAEARARFVGDLFARGIAKGLDGVLPTADELVRSCLAAIPITIAEVTSIDDWRHESLDTIRRLRLAKNLINAAQGHRVRVTHPGTLADLDQWIRFQPCFA
ncbi:hypothetical protein GCM10027280_50220 [Micromonospora polyrhachis]|uniref:Uncharacterized protein n=1 Tax=Micromonospora polyrhachis TaxID=1282883 RepID=A0A7W7WR66_9ACTN|nr:hypothetical protein [Micromonospora polyrhachis]MBB4960770.1 hypothetical protein [Micromonospora polyrhachis]